MDQFQCYGIVNRKLSERYVETYTEIDTSTTRNSGRITFACTVIGDNLESPDIKSIRESGRRWCNRHQKKKSGEEFTVLQFAFPYGAVAFSNLFFLLSSRSKVKPYIWLKLVDITGYEFIGLRGRYFRKITAGSGTL